MGGANKERAGDWNHDGEFSNTKGTMWAQVHAGARGACAHLPASHYAGTRGGQWR